MLNVVGLVIILTIKAKTFAEEDFYYNNGWRPLSREQVLENLHRKFINTPSTEYSTTLYSNPILLDKENIEQIEQNAGVNLSGIKGGLMNEDDDIGIDEKEGQLSSTDQKQNYNSEYLFKGETKIMDEPAPGHRRQAKNIIKNMENVHMNILHSRKDENDIVETKQEGVETKAINSIHGKSNIYEVTEATEINNLLELNLDGIHKKKNYFEPDFETTDNRNLSNILLNILSNYNIRMNDDLTNYAKSRNKHKSNYYKQSYVNSTPRAAPAWNSQNHFPIDPFLAVFLSNYGYYLPGFFGFPGNYNNIYGYLASNNIHNNKPFGAYKIYSDSDSSY